MKVGTLLVCLGVAGLLGYGWHRSEVRRAVETARAKESQDSLVSAVATDRAEREARHAADFLSYEAARRRTASELAGARAESDSLRGILGPLIDSLGPMLPDTMSAFVSRLMAAWKAQNEAWQAERAQVDTSIAAYVARITELESTYRVDVSELDRQIDQCLLQLDRAIKRTSPGILTRIVRALPWVGGAAAGGYLVGKLAP